MLTLIFLSSIFERKFGFNPPLLLSTILLPSTETVFRANISNDLFIYNIKIRKQVYWSSGYSVDWTLDNFLFDSLYKLSILSISTTIVLGQAF